jgi:hypothetical protein
MDGPQRAFVIKVRNTTMSGRKYRTLLPISRIIQCGPSGTVRSALVKTFVIASEIVTPYLKLRISLMLSGSDAVYSFW